MCLAVLVLGVMLVEGVEDIYRQSNVVEIMVIACLEGP